MDYQTAAAAVDEYNKKRSAKEVARKFDVDTSEIFELVSWLWNRSGDEHAEVMKRTCSRVIPALTEDVWAAWLVKNKVPTRMIMRSLGWSLQRTVRKVFALQTAPKKKCGRPRKEKTEKDPTEEEILQRASEVRDLRGGEPAEEKVARVVTQTWTDTRR